MAMRRSSRHLHAAAAVTLDSLASVSAAAQMPPGHVTDGEGVHVDADLTDAEWQERLRFFGLNYTGGYHSNDALCDAVIRSQLSLFSELTLGILDELFLCPTSDFEDIIEDILRELEDYCLEQSGWYAATLSANDREADTCRTVTCT